MAVEKLTYTDPTAQMLQVFQGLGGSKTSQGTTQTSGASPVALQGLEQILAQQMGQISPEGMRAMIEAVFKQGAEKVPVLATQFGQAAGARVGNNSPLMLANQGLQGELAKQAAMMLMQSQQNAGNTAAALANATRSQSTSQTTKQTPKSSMMQALPFLMANAGKFKKFLPGMEGEQSSSIFGTGMNQPVGVTNDGVGFSVPGGSVFGGGGGSSPIDFGGSFDVGSGFDSAIDFGNSFDLAGNFDIGGDFGFDPDFGTGTDFGSLDFGEFFADGGLVSKGTGALASRRNLDDSGDGSTNKKDNSKATDAVVKEPQKRQPSAFDRFIREKVFGAPANAGQNYAKGGLVTKKAPGYAEGGAVTRRGEDKSIDSVGSTPSNIFDESGRMIRGVTYNDGGELVDLIAAMTGVSNPRNPQQARPARPKIPTIAEDPNNGSGPGTSVPSVVGNPDENAAALAGLVSMAAMTSLGLPGIVGSLAMNTMGVPNTSMNPMSQLTQMVMSMVSGGGADGMSGLPGTMAAPDVDGFSQAPPNDSMSTGLTPDGTVDSSMGFANDGIGVGTSTSGDTGGNTGESVSGTYARGGEIDGVGGPTDDLININVSDGEYIVNAESTKMFLPMLEMLNAVGLKNRKQGANNGAR